MTASIAELTEPHRQRPAVRALCLGALATAAVAGLAHGIGLVPAGLAAFVWLGAGAALLSGAAATAGHALLLRDRTAAGGSAPARDAGRLHAMRMQAALGIGFLAKLAGLGIGVGALVAADVKFTGIASFAVAFAAASLVFQLCTALSLARAASGRASTGRVPSGSGSSDGGAAGGTPRGGQTP